MSEKAIRSVNRRDFLKKAGTFTLATGSVAALGGVTMARAEAESEADVMNRYWQKRQAEHEAEEGRGPKEV